MSTLPNIARRGPIKWVHLADLQEYARRGTVTTNASRYKCRTSKFANFLNHIMSLCQMLFNENYSRKVKHIILNIGYKFNE